MMPGWQARFSAWWNGAPAVPRGTAVAVSPQQQAAPVESAGPFWNLERRYVAERLWGRGYLGPPGEAGVSRWLMTVGFTSAMSVANLGVGLGGSTATLHRLFRVYPKSFEADPDLGAAALALASRLGLSRREAVQPFDPEAPILRVNGFDRVLAMDLFHEVVAKQDFLEGACLALKPRGYLLLTGFALGETAEHDDSLLAAWSTLEPAQRPLWRLGEIERELVARNMQVFIAEDESDSYRSAILEGWARLKIDPATIRGNPAIGTALMEEGERWAKCVAALEAGVLRYVRVIGVVA
jgi:SAM-dependent methyltransferase